MKREEKLSFTRTFLFSCAIFIFLYGVVMVPFKVSLLLSLSLLFIFCVALLVCATIQGINTPVIDSIEYRKYMDKVRMEAESIISAPDKDSSSTK